MSIDEAAAFLGELELTDRETPDRRAGAQGDQRAAAGSCSTSGLDYLSLSRPTASLSGGEAQRIRLATQIGSGLVGVLYVLDEPSIGLHQRDNRRLIETLIRLRDLGNTLIVVEHDEDTIRTADWAVDIGPGAGEHGGHVVHLRTGARSCSTTPDSLTGAYLSGRRQIAAARPRRRPRTKGREVTVHQAVEHNLQDVTVSFPLGQLIAVTGVSGSGKSTLVNSILYTALAKRIYNARDVPGPAPLHHRRRRDRQGHPRRPVADRPHAAVQPGDLHRGVRPRAAGCSPRPRRPRSAATSRAGSRSTSRAAAARTAPATARSRSR